MPKALITAGPTREPIDPVRYISNRSSGKQGYAIAEILAKNDYEVHLVSGPVTLEASKNIFLYKVETAREMYDTCLGLLVKKFDLAILVAAVSDYRPEKVNEQKIKKSSDTLTLTLKRNPDILEAIAEHELRPKTLIAFAAETENLIENAKAKLLKKNCDLIVANDVSLGRSFDIDHNQVSIISKESLETWPEMDKKEIAEKLYKLVKDKYESSY